MRKQQGHNSFDRSAKAAIAIPAVRGAQLFVRARHSVRA